MHQSANRPSAVILSVLLLQALSCRGTSMDTGYEWADTAFEEVPCSDADADGFNARACGGEDCDDDDASVNPERAEITGNTVDENCNGSGDADRDGDGWTVDSGDCDDQEPSAFPSGVEYQNDGIDGDCSGDLEDGGQVGCTGSEYTSIQIAIDHVRTGGVIEICGGIYTEALQISKSLTLKKRDGDSEVFISGGLAWRPITINSGQVKLMSLDIHYGYTSGDGGGVYVGESADVEIYGSDISDNGASRGGGVYVADGGSLYLPNNIIANNVANVGGGLFVQGSAVIDPYNADVYMWSNQSTESTGATAAVEGGVLRLAKGDYYLNLFESADWSFANFFVGEGAIMFAFDTPVGDPLSVAMSGAGGQFWYSTDVAFTAIFYPDFIVATISGEAGVCLYDSLSCSSQ